jgi:hypothetical protein
MRSNNRLVRTRVSDAAFFQGCVRAAHPKRWASKSKSKNKLDVARLRSSSLSAAKNRKWRVSEMNQSRCFPSAMQRSLSRAAFSISPASVSSSPKQCIVIGKLAPNKCLKFARRARPTRKSEALLLSAYAQR